MAELFYMDQPLAESLPGLLEKERIDLIVTSGFIFNNPLYADIRDLLLQQKVPVKPITQSLTLASIDDVLADTPFTHPMVVGGGRLVDFFKVVCARRDIGVSVLLTNLSNDGFASGCSALPLSEGGEFVTIKSCQPTSVFAFQDLLRRMPREFILSGLGETISKLQVMEDLRFEFKQVEIDRIFCQPLEALYDLLFREFTIHHYNDREFLFRLTRALYEYSTLMSTGSSLCSRSEHEFEKVCTIHGINLRHGTLVLIGAMVSMKMRQTHASYFGKKGVIFTYDTLLKVVVKFKLTKHVRESIQLISRHLLNADFRKGLKDLSRMRPERVGLWNYVDSRLIDWKVLFRMLDQDLKKMKSNPDRKLLEVLEH